MKKVVIVFLLIFMVAITGCSSSEKRDVEPIIVPTTLNEEENVIINESDITETAIFFNYEIDGVTIGLIAVRGTDGKVRVAFNTCQSCSPSPNAYFVQKGEYFECQNCETLFHIDKIGDEKGGCNPAPIEEIKIENGIMIISADYLKEYKSKFKNWNGQKL